MKRGNKRENLGIIRQCPASDFQFRESTLVVAVIQIDKTQGKVRFTEIGPQS
jgi:hypothetical protein